MVLLTLPVPIANETPEIYFETSKYACVYDFKIYNDNMCIFDSLDILNDLLNAQVYVGENLTQMTKLVFDLAQTI